MSVKRRVERLEAIKGSPGLEFVGIGRLDWSEEDLDQAAAEAQKRLGPGGTVIKIGYIQEAGGYSPTMARYQAEGVEPGGLLPVAALVGALREAEKAVNDE